MFLSRLTRCFYLSPHEMFLSRARDVFISRTRCFYLAHEMFLSRLTRYSYRAHEIFLRQYNASSYIAIGFCWFVQIPQRFVCALCQSNGVLYVTRLTVSFVLCSHITLQDSPPPTPPVRVASVSRHSRTPIPVPKTHQTPPNKSSTTPNTTSSSSRKLSSKSFKKASSET